MLIIRHKFKSKVPTFHTAEMALCAMIFIVVVKVGSYHYIVLQFIAALFLLINAPVAGVCETSV
jgi:hypothetical protein